MAHTRFAGIVSLLILLSCNDQKSYKCLNASESSCNIDKLTKIYELPQSGGSGESSVHYVLIPNYEKCCAGKIDFLKAAVIYKDSAKTKSEIAEVIFLFDTAGLFNDDMIPNDQKLPNLAIASIRFGSQIGSFPSVYVY